MHIRPFTLGGTCLAILLYGCGASIPDQSSAPEGAHVGTTRLAIFSPVQAGPQAYSGVFRVGPPGVSTRTALNVPETTFFAASNGTMTHMSAQGYNLTSVDIQVVNNTRFYNAVFQSGLSATQLWDLTWADFQAKVQALDATGMRLICLKSYVLNGARFYTGIFQQSTDFQAFPGAMDYLTFSSTNQAQSANGFSLTNVDVFTNGTTEQYLGVWRSRGSSPAFWVGDWNGLAKANFDEAALGRRLVDMRTWQTDSVGASGTRRYAGVWVTGPDAYDLVAATSLPVFTRKVNELANAGKVPIRINFENGYMPPAGLAAAFHDKLDPGAMGYGYAVNEAKATTASGGFGYARAPWESQNPGVSMTDSTRLDIASAAKAVTSAAMLRLLESPAVQLSKTTLDTTFMKIIGAGISPVGTGVGSVTLRELLEMKSGLVLNADCGFSDANWLRDIIKTDTHFTPGSQFEYNGTNQCVLRQVIQQLSKQTFETYLASAIFRPLGIHTPVPSCQPDLMTPTRPLYYTVGQTSGPGAEAGPTAQWEAACGPGALQLTTSQLGTFLLGLTGNKVLTAQDLDVMKSQQMGLFAATTVLGAAYVKNGGSTQSTASGGATSAIAILPNSTQVGVETNAFDGVTLDAQDAVLDGFTRMYSYPTRTFVLQNGSDRLCASVQFDSKSDSAFVVEFACLAPSGANQRFVFRDTGNGHFMLQTLSSGRCLTVEFASVDDGTQVVQYECIGGKNQTFTRGTNGQLVNDNSGKCVDVSGSNLVQSTCSNTASQRWILGSENGTLEYASGSIYQVASASSSLCASIQGNSNLNDAQFVQFTCLSPAVSNQEFIWHDVGGGHFALVALNSGKCLTVQFASSDDNINMIQYDCLGKSNQSFTLQSTNDGRVNIVNDSSGKCVTVAGNSVGNNVGLIQFGCISGALNQEWIFQAP